MRRNVSPYRTPAEMPKPPRWGATRWRRLVVRVMGVIEPPWMRRMRLTIERMLKENQEMNAEIEAMVASLRFEEPTEPEGSNNG